MVKPYIHVDVCLYRCLNMRIRGKRSKETAWVSLLSRLEKGYGGAEPAALVQVKDLVQLLDACPL